ncbi:hypothetical protein BRADI_4g27988v3, partial [Brachypodium distachyon]
QTPFQGLQRQVYFKIDEASKILKNARQRFLDAIVDSTFKFADQVLLPSESNFAPVDEISGSIEILQIEGEIAQDFPEGVYIRNGSNPLFGALHSTTSVFGQSREIWVEGEGMLHALYFTKNHSSSWSIEKARQKPYFLPAVEGDSAAIMAAYILNYLRFAKVNKNISNTNVFEHAGRDLGREWDRPFTTHPKVVPGTGELVIFGSGAKRPFLVFGVVSDDGTKLKHKVDLKMGRCTLCRDIGVTLKYADSIINKPLTIDIGGVTKSGQLIKFEKDGYARIGIMPRYGDAESVMWFDVEPFCMFHLINCFEEGDEVIVQGLRSADSAIPGPRHGLNKHDMLPETCDLTINGKIMKQGINEKLFSRLYEWRLNLKTKTVLGEYLTGTELSLEFPMINDQYTGVHQNYAYAQIVDSVTRSAGTSEKVLPKYGGFAKLYLEERDNTSAEDLIKMENHWLGEDQFCSGASFVRRVGASREDDGWIISFVHNERTNTSQVHIIDTLRFEGAPIVKITLPQRVPYGFHGTFVHNPKTGV